MDVRSTRYAKRGAADPSDLPFPYPDAAFDMVCAFEVFMHIPLDGVRNYLDEIRRVLRPEGTAVLTFMAIWEHEDEPVYQGRPWVSIGGGVRTRFPEKDGLSMGYEIGLLREVFRTAGLDLITEIEGLWHSPWKERPSGPVHRCDLFELRPAQ
jgi:SAM-dependent methyltransferase